MLSNYQDFEDVLRLPSMENNLTKLKPNIGSILRADFFTRFTSIQSWFMRCSFVNKLKFIKGMLEILNERDSAPEWLKVIQENRVDKLAAYAEILKFHRFNYDKVVLDTDRTLDPETLKRTIESDLQWFYNFDEDLQEEVFLALLSLGGGGLMRMLCKEAKLQKTKRIPAKADSKPTEERNEVDKDEELCEIMALARNYSESLDPKNDDDLIVIKKRKGWSDMMGKYRAALQAKEHGKEKVAKKKKSEKASKKSSKKSTKKSSKKTSTEKSGGNKSCEEIDYVSDGLTSYKKSLKKAKTVNPYWEFAINNMAKDAKARKMLDKAMKQLQDSIPEGFESQNKECVQKRREAVRLNETAASKKIMRKLWMGPFEQEDSLMIKAIDEMAENYNIPINGNLETFPRRKLRANECGDLYKGLPMIISECGAIEKRVSELKPISEEINISKKMLKIEVYSPIVSSVDLNQLYAPSVEDLV